MPLLVELAVALPASLLVFVPEVAVSLLLAPEAVPVEVSEVVVLLESAAVVLLLESDDAPDVVVSVPLVVLSVVAEVPAPVLDVVAP